MVVWNEICGPKPKTWTDSCYKTPEILGAESGVWGGVWPTKEFRNWIHKILCENTERCSLTGFSPVYKHRDTIHHHDASVVSLGGFVFGFRSDLTECEEVTSTQHKSLQLNYTNEPLNVRTAFNLILKTCVGVIFSWVLRKNRGKKKKQHGVTLMDTSLSVICGGRWWPSSSEPGPSLLRCWLKKDRAGDRLALIRSGCCC